LCSGWWEELALSTYAEEVFICISEGEASLFCTNASYLSCSKMHAYKLMINGITGRTGLGKVVENLKPMN
jgi:hypothetical protein